MEWQVSLFSELTTVQLYDLLKLRVDIFVVEQACSYPELDGKDCNPQTLHLLGYDTKGALQAYARILPPGLSYASMSIGRVAVVKAYRGQGVAQALMAQAIQIAQANWPSGSIQIGAQEYLMKFYESLGFIAVSAVYLEDGIPHLDMRLG